MLQDCLSRWIPVQAVGVVVFEAAALAAGRVLVPRRKSISRPKAGTVADDVGYSAGTVSSNQLYGLGRPG